MSGLFRKRTFLRHSGVKPRYDVVVIGGGVNGLSLAYNLAASHGITNVAVFERAYIGSGGSGRNTQVVRANYNTPETVPLYKRSLEIWRTLSAELDLNILFSTQGELDLCHTRDSLEIERDKSLLNRAYGVHTDVLTVDDVLKVCPLVDVTGGGELPVLGASYHPPFTRGAPSPGSRRSGIDAPVSVSRAGSRSRPERLSRRSRATRRSSRGWPA